MDRRVSGGLILLLAVLTVLVVPRVLNPTLSEGRAAIEPPPPPPSVGDCLLDPISSMVVNVVSGVVQPSMPTVVPCTDPHRGEVVNVDLDFHPVVLTESSVWNDYDNPCGDDSRLQYLGVDTDATQWQPTIAVDLATAGPSPRQYAAGQRWAACVLTTRTYAATTGSLRDIFRHGGAPASVALCFTGSDVEPLRVNAMCTGPHTAELFAIRMLPPDSTVTRAELDAECAALVGRATNRTSTDGVLVRTETMAYYVSGEADVVEPPLPAGATDGSSSCFAAATDGQRFNASLRLIGDAPLPWAP